ncbi:dienelactone hydrolase family protein [Mycolicibacterium neworleansense]|uniref:Alpha/beta hydrolase family protein n=1 Tax=Mycolicibacterium neworleansense TaxID=146018 RepID=A0A0H5RKN9_9MYCO|nr:alpha/beta hydrolase [Mycolicibacterium neworleansense]MCV7363376.1 alpha/beta hydrolase [Mycolicibacterium neworleansense]CRZ14311.1 Alpha/beta hydrolase family protein [Mycolicibacterium neworleansense]
MYFTSETSASGVTERSFILDEITGVLWSPTVGTVGSPLLLLGHSGGMHKKAPGLVATALHSVTRHGFAVVAIDAPGHGDRARNPEDQRWNAAIHRAREARRPIAPIVTEYSMSLAERAVPEWKATLDALQALPDVGAGVPIGYGGVSLGVVTGLLLTAVEARIAAVSFGAAFVDDDALLEAARKITVPVEYRIPWEAEEFDRTSGLALFDAFASKEKALHARSGRHHPTPDYERDSSAQFFARHLLRAADTFSSGADPG